MFKLIQRSRYIDFNKFSIGLLSRISSAPRRSLRLHSSNSPINSNEKQKVKVYDSNKLASVGFSHANLNSSIAMDGGQGKRELVKVNPETTKQSNIFLASVLEDDKENRNGSTGRRGKRSSGIGNFFGKDHPLNRSIPVDVHNSCEAEIMAAKVALENILKWKKYKKNQPVIICTDFLEMVNAMNNGQMGGKFHDLYVELRKLTERFCSVVFEHVRGHSGVEGNEEADRIARMAANGRALPLLCCEKSRGRKEKRK
ncbi:hypothetical protein PRIPAC_75546 [Pristionchus pacificus]|nr:hypothetical protein PRIPAC_75546 [Pristionchus pacificus]